MSLKEDLIRINDALSSTLQGINSLLPFEAETLKDAPPIIEVAIGSARKEGEESGYSTGYDDGYGAAESFIVYQSNEAIEKYTTPAEDWSEIPSKIDEVHAVGVESGEQAEYDAFWDVYQENGKRVNYNAAFYGYGWTDETFKPKYDFGAPTHATDMFCSSQITDIKGTFETLGFTLDFSKVTSALRIFMSSKTKRIGVVDLSDSSDNRNLMGYCPNLVSVDKVVFAEKAAGNGFGGSFQQLPNLESIVFEGVIAAGISFQWSPKLTHDSLMSIIAALKDLTGTDKTYTLTIGATNYAKLTQEEVEIAQNKGWLVK